MDRTPPKTTPARPDLEHARAQVLPQLGHHLGQLRTNLVFFVLFVALSVVGGWYLRQALLDSAYESNAALSHSYALETTSQLTIYKTLLDYGTASIDERVGEGATWEELEEWVDSYCGRMRTVMDMDTLYVYGVVNGQILLSGDRSVGEDFDVSERSWYVDALANRGATTFSDLYVDELTGQPVITVSQACEEADAVLAFDLHLDDLLFRFSAQNLPVGTSFYLTDAAGDPLYYETTLSTCDGLEDYLAGLIAASHEEGGSDQSFSATDLDGRERAVSCTELENGWHAIVTTPHELILGRMNLVYGAFAAMVAVFVVAFVVLGVRDWKSAQKVERANATVRTLVNSYYAVYLVNYEKGTYEMIKATKDMAVLIPRRGPYQAFLQAARGFVADESYEEFREAFSADSLRNLVRRKASDFGGDFQRRFGDQVSWVNVRVLFDDALARDEAVLCFRTVDQEKARQLQERRYLKDALDTARQSAEAKQAFFNSMSHDMRTPLNAVIGLTELACQSVDDPERTVNYLLRIESSGKQLLALINDILDLSRMERGMVSVTPERMDLASTLADCLAPFELQACSEGKRMEVALDVRDPWVLGDPARLGQVLNNLLSNALKYTRPGDLVRVEASRAHGSESVSTYRIVVADTGMGMAADFLPHLFEVYVREQRFGTRKTEGTGLGMPITKSLVEQMGGTIEVESELEVGTTFTVTLPFALPPASGVPTAPTRPVGEKDEPAAAGTAAPAAAGTAALLAAGETAGAAGTAGADPAPGSLAGVRVLLAEDNEINAEIATEMLEAEGMVVTHAWNGQEAVDAFAASELGGFDVVLMDMQMPVMDGLEAARALRALARPDAAVVPVIAVTANAFAEDVAAVTMAGMDAHVAKPLDFAALRRTIARLVRPAACGGAGAPTGSGAAPSDPAAPSPPDPKGGLS